MKKLSVYLKGYIKESILGPLFKLLEASFELFVPIVIKSIVDVGIGQADKVYIIKMCLLLILLGVVGMVCSVTAQYFAAKASVGFVTKLRRALFEHIGKLSYTEIDTLGTSSMITRMTSDMNQVQTGLNLTLRLLLRSPFIVFGAMIMAFTVDAEAAFTFVVAIPALSIVVFAIMLLSIPLYRKVQHRLDRVLNSTRENLAGVRVIRAFRLEENEMAEFDKRNEELTSTQKFVGRISALMNPLTYVIINLAIIWLIYIGAIRVSRGLITQGAVLALYNYMSQILVELIKFANLIISITKAVASANRISAVLDVKPSLEERESIHENGRSEYAVEFNHVGLKYKNAGGEALTNINFSVRRGEVVGIIGGTGSGKTSLVNLIPRFYDATVGEVIVDGVNVKDYSLKELRDKIGIVPQKAVLFKGSIRENMRWGNKNATDEEIMEAINIAQAGEIVAQKKEGLDFFIEQGGKNLSGGQRQRFTIARALVKKPEILILDDSASALDFATDAALRKALRDLPGNPTIFIVSQRTSSIQFADKIVVLDDGEIAGIGKHDELLETCEVYREIYDSQFKKEGR
ncbi:MAG TPA: ABC transporter ATP-binding protein [Acetivibrio sp.]|uniref:ABC transporter ATP-binding protein n=1 Tax=Acetivibrio sp. TaxID=1872092 RepID=UPI002BA813D6|nr:ABC transporter ATP-binding protein [Acetivibrio sp.]HOM02034.1 ABC transporter ATP-binding protein [Acetivibrio sp.]